MTTKYIDYLNEDKPIPGQLWVCISFLSPEGLKNCSVYGLKIRGVFGTRKEAESHANELQKTDPDFHVFVGEMGKWLPWNPSPDSIDDNVYQEKELNNLMKEYKKNMAKAKEMEEQRKRDMLEKAAREEQFKSARPVDQKRAKLQEKLAKQRGNVEDLEGKDFKEEEDKINAEKVQLRKVQENVEAKESKISEFDDKLSKIQDLYNKLQDKQ
jgi:DNA repair exonuclease SbcCD ATPase subunit